uniref:Uncharacterized protein n=1 Tax=Arundo donax TaxID=35708 RepID=A0A0A9DJ71_ARUDO
MSCCLDVSRQFDRLQEGLLVGASRWLVTSEGLHIKALNFVWFKAVVSFLSVQEPCSGSPETL